MSFLIQIALMQTPAMSTDNFIIGGFVEGEVQELKDYGVVLGFKDHDAVGFVSQYHCN